MTPLRLTLHEFGPYTDSQEIDFTQFNEQRLFLIHGPTGSGKTALLDAICFAIYGETSGDERDGQELRSDFADGDAPTEVQLDFRLGDRRFRITRRPMQSLDKQRGDGVRTHSHRATLYERTHLAAGADEDGKTVADGKRDVDAKVQELLGFEVDQFRQVVMLPQGKFRRFLSSSSKDREDLLKVMFETEPFEALQEEFFEMKKEAQAEVERVQDRQSGVLERHGVDSPDGLEEKREKAERIHGMAEDWLAELQSREDDAVDALQSARSDQEKLDERDEARAAVEALNAQMDEHEERTRTLQAAEQAAKVAPYQSTMEDRKEEAESAKTALKKAVAERDEKADALEAAETAMEQEKERDDKRDRLRDRLSTLSDLAETVESLGTVKSELDAAEEKKSDAEERLEKAEEKKDDLETQVSEAEATYETVQATARQLELLEAKAETAERRLSEAQTLATKREALAEAEARVEEAEGAVESRKARLTDAETHLSGLEQRRMDGYATVLADDLSEGEPCPVCGSHEHPHPATGAHDVPAREELAEARAAVDAAREALTDAREELSAAQKEEAQIQTSISDILERDEDLGEEEVSSLEETRDSAQAQLEEAQSAKEDLITLDEELSAHREKLDALDAEIEEARAAVQAADTEITRLASRRDTLAEDVPEELSTPEALAEARDTAQETLDELKAALETARTEREEAKTAFTEAKTTVENARSRLNEATEKAETAEGTFREKLQSAGFESRAAYDDALQPENEREALRRRIKQFESDLSEARGRFQRAKEQAADIESPDVEAAEARVASLKGWVERQQQRTFQVQRVAEDTASALDDLSDLREALQAADERYRDVGALADAARGKNDHNLSLQRFVLATRLEDVLEVANQHVARMSQDRYRLRRHDEVRHGNRAAGLDLTVHDAYTGTERPVSTLSGGEGFQAALALALGLSEVVQRVAGGRHIETIFIDEGFGSLDPEALDRAMESLASLQAGGRLVGIISHVADLKQRVQARIEVTPSQEGSTVRMVS